MTQSCASSVYWEQRAVRFAREGEGLAAVCSYGMPAFYNKAIQWTQRHALRPHIGTWSGRRVLDVGCGVGRWSLQLAAQGNHVVGMDLSQTMVDVARRRAVEQGLSCRFQQGNVVHADLDDRFDSILVVTVLQHILDPVDVRRAIDNLVRHLNPGGSLVLLEAAPTGAQDRCDTNVFHARCESDYRELLMEAGLRVDRISGVDPIPLKTWLLPYYKKLPMMMAQAALAGVTAVSLPLDLLLGSRLPHRSWHKIIVASRD